MTDSIRITTNRNDLETSCEIEQGEDDKHTIWISVETVDQDLTEIEGEIRQRINEDLNKCIRFLEKDK